MKLSIDFSSLSREVSISRDLPNQTRARVKTAILKVSNTTMWRVKSRMPVDTGNARANWGILTPELFTLNFLRKNRPLTTSIWRVEKEGLSITQGSGMAGYNYIDALNMGHSRQAPALFLNSIQEWAADDLMRELDT